MGIQKFEDIRAWQEARKLVQKIYSITGKTTLSRDFGLKDQIQRAAVSSMTNIAEGFDCDSKKEFARFLGIARRSAVEVQSLLYVVFDTGHIDQLEFSTLKNDAEKVKRTIGALKGSLRF